MTTVADVERARDRIAGRVRVTPTYADPSGTTFKLEHLQVTGSFKARGAFAHQLLAQQEGRLGPAGVVAASGGNAGLAHAYAAAALGVPATVFVPTTAPAVKVASLRSLGATVHQVGSMYAEAFTAATAHADTTGALFCHAYDLPEVVAGAGTLGLELLEQVPDLDTVVVAVGGGGLYAGVSAALDGRIRVVAAEPERAAALQAAIAAGAPVPVPVSGVAADSLGATVVGDHAFGEARVHPPVSVTVTDDAVVDARRRLWRDHRIVVEHGAATAYAALTAGVYRPADGERVVVVLCGANTDPTDLSEPPVALAR